MQANSGLSRTSFSSFHRVAGQLFFLVLLIYSIVYAVERVSYVDSAWLFFERVNGECFSFPGSRYSAFFSELPLFIATKLHLSLAVLVYVFSISYIVLYYLVWRICTFALKNPAAGLTVIFGTIMGVREAFLHPVTETHQMIAYSALLYALLCAGFKTRPLLKNILLVFATLLVLFAHPFGIFTAGFAIAFYMISTKRFKDMMCWLLLLLILAVAVFNYLHPANPYDASQYAQIETRVPLTSSAALNFLLIHFTHFYWLPELAGLIATVWLFFRKEWLKLVLVFVAVSAYLILAFITFRHGDASIMLERIFLPAFFMINLVLADLLASDRRPNRWIPMVLVVFFLVNGIHYINAGCLYYKKRVAYLDEIVKAGMAQGHDQYFLSDARTDMTKILGKWALGTETLIYSKLKYDRCISISMKGEICEPGNCRVTIQLCLPVTELNPHYFHLSGEAYSELK